LYFGFLYSLSSINVILKYNFSAAPFVILFTQFAFFWALEFRRIIADSRKHKILAEYGNIELDILPNITKFGIIKF